MRVDIETNSQPITVGDHVGIAIRTFAPWDLPYLWYRIDLVGPGFTRKLGTLSLFQGLTLDWAVDRIGFGLMFKATGIGLGWTTAFSDPFDAFPLGPLLVSPHQGETIGLDSDYTLEWKPAEPDPDHGYAVSFSRDGGATFEAFDLEIPGAARSARIQLSEPATDSGVVRLFASFDGFLPLHSDVSVRTVSPPTVTVTQPTPGTSWQIGELARISWRAGGQITRFVVDITRNGGHSWAPIATVGPTERHFSYHVQGPSAENAKVRVTAQGPGGSRSDENDGLLRIRPAT